MEERERIRRWNDKEDLLDEIKATFGVEPPGIRQALAILTHPEIIEHAMSYLKTHDNKHVCTKYESPMTCDQEDDFRYESATRTWLNSDSTVVIPGHWCEPCRQQALNLK